MLTVTLKDGQCIAIGNCVVKVRRRGSREFYLVVDAPDGVPIARQSVAEAFLFGRGWTYEKTMVDGVSKEISPWRKEGAPDCTMREALVLEDWHRYGSHGTPEAEIDTAWLEATKRSMFPLSIDGMDASDMGGIE